MEMKFKGYTREVCNFTEAMDKCLKPMWKKSVEIGCCLPTYLMYDETDLRYRKIPFRFPGATRGNIKIKSDYKTIEDVVFDEDTSFGPSGCYELVAMEECKKFIGKCFLEGREEI